MNQHFFADDRFAGAMSYPAYLELMAEEAAQDTTGFDEEDTARVEATRLNQHRSGRITRTYQPAPELAALVDGITEAQFWLALTEPWCGDSAQCLPYFAVLAERNPQIELGLLLRDEHPEIMDQYLTRGNRSIPIVVGFAADGRELFRWGPRPVAGQEVFDAAKAEGLEKPQILERLHLWYGRNRGHALEEELVSILRKLA